jgi:hypothetical protein
MHQHIEGVSAVYNNDLPKPIICIFDNYSVIVITDVALLNDHHHASAYSFINEL